MNWFLLVYKKYATFSGRSQRAEYWYFILFYFLIFIPLAIVDGLTGTYSEKGGVGLLSGLFLLASIIPSFSVAFRRLHDTGRSGWWLLILFIPLVGAVIFIYFMVIDSDAGDNAYGANPKLALSS